jgi:peptide/nickel transport system ATP-binding protein
MSAILSLHEASKHYIQYTRQGAFEIRALDRVSIDIVPGKHIGVIGESGSGKTTLGKVLVKLIEPDSGTLYFKEKDVTKARGRRLREFRSNVQMIFQDPYSSLDPRIRVSDLLRDFVKLRHGTWNEGVLEESLSTVGLSKDIGNKLPAQLSGGQRQRVAIARALTLNPSVIVADEPVSALDVSVRSQILKLLSDIKQKLGITYVFITHDVSSLYFVVDYVSVMYRGSVVEQGDIGTLVKEPLHPYTKALIAAVPDFGKDLASPATSGPSAIDLESEPSVGCKYYPRCPYAMEVCKKEHPPLFEMGQGKRVACYLYDNSENSKSAKLELEKAVTSATAKTI